MKIIVFATIGLLMLITNLKAQDSLNLVSGVWQLKMILSDPGDGSGKFEFTNSDKTISFSKDRTFISIGSFCTINETSPSVNAGYYSEENLTITPLNCKKDLKLTFKVENGNLIVYYFCKESCAELYTKTKK